jgi:hypothetical protein
MLITFFSNVGQLSTKCHYSVDRFLERLRVGLVLADDIQSLVRAGMKSIPDGVGRCAFLLSQSRIDRLMQSPVKLGEVSHDSVSINDRIVENLHGRSAYPLGANQNRRPFARRVIGYGHLQIASISDFAWSEAWKEDCMSESLTSAR